MTLLRTARVSVCALAFAVAACGPHGETVRTIPDDGERATASYRGLLELEAADAEGSEAREVDFHVYLGDRRENDDAVICYPTPHDCALLVFESDDREGYVARLAADFYVHSQLQLRLRAVPPSIEDEPPESIDLTLVSGSLGPIGHAHLVRDASIPLPPLVDRRVDEAMGAVGHVYALVKQRYEESTEGERTWPTSIEPRPEQPPCRPRRGRLAPELEELGFRIARRRSAWSYSVVSDPEAHVLVVRASRRLGCRGGAVENVEIHAHLGADGDLEREPGFVRTIDGQRRPMP